MVSKSQNQAHFRYDVINLKFGQIWVTLKYSLNFGWSTYENYQMMQNLCRIGRGFRKIWFEQLKIAP